MDADFGTESQQHLAYPVDGGELALVMVLSAVTVVLLLAAVAIGDRIVSAPGHTAAATR